MQVQTETRTKGPLPKFGTILFDLGGTIVDDLDIVYDITLQVFRLLGKPRISRDQYVANLLPIQKLYRVVGLDDRESAESIKLYNLFLSERIDNVRLFPDVMAALSDLKRKNVKIGIVTQYSRKPAEQILNRLGIANYVDSIVSFEDSDEQKPSAKPVLKAVRKLRSTPQSTAFVGDTREDIVAGHAARVWTIGVCRKSGGYHTREMLIQARPDRIVESLSELTTLLP